MGTLEQVARAMFDAYNAEGPNPNKTWDGKDVPPWESLNDQVRGKWKAAAALGLRHTPAAVTVDAIVERNRAEWEVTVAKVLAPLLERVDASEKRAAEVNARAEALSAKVMVERSEQDKMRLDEARKRFRASLIIQLLSTSDASLHETKFDQEHQTMLPDGLDFYIELVDVVLKKAGV